METESLRRGMKGTNKCVSEV